MYIYIYSIVYNVNVGGTKKTVVCKFSKVQIGITARPSYVKTTGTVNLQIGVLGGHLDTPCYNRACLSG